MNHGIRTHSSPRLVNLCLRAEELGATTTAAAIRKELTRRGLTFPQAAEVDYMSRLLGWKDVA